jgi:FkbM family methyltransferase
MIVAVFLVNIVGRKKSINLYMFKLKSFFKQRPEVTFSEHTYFPDLISAQPVLFDIGACLGAFSEHFLSQYPNGKVVLLEPNPTNFKKIHIESDRCLKLNMALSITPEKILFYEDLNSTQTGSILFNYFDGVKHEIETINLDDLLRDYEQVDLVKMDIEGAEWEILLNSKDETLLKIQQLSVEFHDFLDKSKSPLTLACIKRLKKLGYGLKYKSTDYKLGCKYYDCLFYKK